ncbi:hypothetical protein [Nonomuraea rubra]
MGRRRGGAAVHARWVIEDRGTLLRTVAGYGSPVALVVEDGPP